MECKFFCIALILLFSASIYHAEGRANPDAAMVARHERWMARHGRVYKDEAEKAKRFQIFKANAEFIDSVNAAGLSYKLAENAFADLTNDEFRSRNKYIPHPRSAAPEHLFNSSAVNIPTSIDWRSLGAVTPIKDQGQCGSCWAFGTVAAVEGINKIKKGTLVSLSEQELVDCDSDCYGCDGGWAEVGLQFVTKYGLTTESNYIYKAADGTCNTQKESQVSVKTTGYKMVASNSESALKTAVASQPVAVTIDASGSAFQFYSSGIFTGSCGTNLDHVVTAVGYSTTGTTPYWIVKNSWGTSWGESGYIRMKMGVGAKGICGIAMEASYPTM